MKLTKEEKKFLVMMRATINSIGDTIEFNEGLFILTELIRCFFRRRINDIIERYKNEKNEGNNTDND